MDAQRFDDLTRAMLGGRSRRVVLRALLGGVAAGLLGARGAREAGATHKALGDVCTCPEPDVPCAGHCASRYCKDGRCRCKPPTRNCGGQCVNTKTDPDHCGGCVCDGCAGDPGEVCTEAPANATPACIRGACDFKCNAEFKRCGEGCIPTEDCCTAADCADGKPCTRDVCRANGACANPPRAAGAACPGGVCDGAGNCGECLPGETRPCYTGPDGSEGVGTCHGGTQTCDQDRTWGGCEGEVVPTTDACNGLDEDCDGIVDDAASCDLGTTCQGGRCVCTSNNEPRCNEVCCPSGETCCKGSCCPVGRCNSTCGCGQKYCPGQGILPSGTCCPDNGVCYIDCGPFGSPGCWGPGRCRCADNRPICGNACCTSTQVCSDGQCAACPGGQHICNGACVSNSSPATCGTACTPCQPPANATATCDGTACGFTCNQGYTNCDGECVDTSSDSRHCGGCDRPCEGPCGSTGSDREWTCNNGLCQCVASS